MKTDRRRRGRLPSTIALLPGMFAAPCFGQEASPSFAANPIIVTGTRLPGSTRFSGNDVTIISKADIETRHSSSAVELLRSIPGVLIEQAGSRGSVASVFTRGAKPNFTVVMIDGVKVNDDTNTRGGSFDFSTLSLDLIDRIEIIRGPESAIYGSLAAGGVINIITREVSTSPTGNLNASVGESGYWALGGDVGGKVGPVPITLAVSHTDNGEPAQGSHYQGTSVGASTSAPVSDRASLQVTARYGTNHLASFPDDSGGPLLAVIRALDYRHVDEVVLGVREQNVWTPQWSQSVQYGLYNRTSQETSPGVAPSIQDAYGIPPSADNVHYRQQQLGWTQTLTPATRFRAALGLDWQDEAGADHGYLKYGAAELPTSFSLHRDITAAYVEAGWQILTNWDLNAAARYDSSSNGGSRFSPQMSTRYSGLPAHFDIRVSWGEGYKLPSFYSLGNPLVGNPQLKAETSRSWEAGLSKPFESLPLTLKLNAFKTTYKNLIDFNPGPVPALVNRATVFVHGAEASAALQLAEQWTLEAHVSNTVTRDRDTGSSLRDVPQWLAGADIQWRPQGNTIVHLRIFHVGAYVDNAVPTGDVRLPGYQRCDLSVSQTLSKYLSVYATVENLLDRQYQEAIGFPAPGVFPHVGLRWAMK